MFIFAYRTSEIKSNWLLIVNSDEILCKTSAYKLSFETKICNT